MSVRVRGLVSVCVVSLCVWVGVLVLSIAPAQAAIGHEFGGSFGGEGSGAGQFKEPSGVAVNDATGDVYVVDKGNNRVQEFSAGGAFIAQFDGSAAPTGALSFPSGIAVDNSGDPLDPSAGDVYVIDGSPDAVYKFSESGVYEGQISEAEGGSPFGALDGVAVDSTGQLWVYQASNEIDSFSDALVNEFLSKRESPFGTSPGFAVDSEDNLYVNRGGEEVAKLTSSGFTLIGEVDHERTSNVAVNLVTNEVFIDNLSTVGVFTSGGAPAGRFGAGRLTAGDGLAVDPSLPAKVYVADSSTDKVDIFDEIILPSVHTGTVSGIHFGGVALNGVVNPEGVQAASCEFEYGTTTAYGHTAVCTQTPAEIGSGNGPVPVSAEVSALEPNTTYHFRLVAANANGTETGSDETLLTSGPPSVAGVSLSSVGPYEAGVSARIDPNELASSYIIEYGPTTAYGSATAPVNIGDGTSQIAVSTQISGLQPETVYHFRVVASNEGGVTPSADTTFTTRPVEALGLPDGRGYELVTPLNNENAEVYAQQSGFSGLDEHGIGTKRPFRAAADGEAVAYVGSPGASGNGSSGLTRGNDYLATRGPEGWVQQNITPSGSSTDTEYVALSSDLSVGIIDGGLEESSPLVAEAPGGGYNVLYARDLSDGSYHPLFTVKPPDRGPYEFYTYEFGYERLAYAGSSSDLSHLLFEANDALPGATPATVDGGERENNLYDSVNGQLQSVNVLPDGAAEPNATFGALTFGGSSENGDWPDFSHVISADGSRIFWTDLNTGVVYVRENATRTVAVSAGAARFWAASTDGRYAFYTEGEKLWRFDVESETREELAGENAEVQGVIGVNETGEDGEYVYFVADGELAAGADQGQPNLYLRHGGVTTFIATLSPDDDRVQPFTSPGGGDDVGDWQPGLGNRTAEMTPDGHSLVFMSRRSLTGYNNEGLFEVFVYDADTGGLSCASCDPSGVPPQEGAVQGSIEVAGYLPISYSAAYMPRSISEDGGRVFFNSPLSLVSRDTNGSVDAYEWERDGEGSCRRSAGCIYLLSGGTSKDNSYFIDAGASGDDVFFMTRGQLVEQDRYENFNLYDARVNGGKLPPSLPVCTGSGCQGVPAAAPIFATPASATFNGVGNFAAAGEAAPAKQKRVKPKPKRKVKHRKSKKKKSAKKASGGRRTRGKAGRS